MIEPNEFSFIKSASEDERVGLLALAMLAVISRDYRGLVEARARQNGRSLAEEIQTMMKAAA